MGAGCSSESSAADQGPVKPAPAPVAPASKGAGSATAAASAGSASAPAAAAAAPLEELPPLSPEDAEELDHDRRDPDSGTRNPQARLDSLTRCFEALDKDKSGTIDFKELKQYLFKTGVNIHQIIDKAEELMKKMDLNADNMISLDEFTQMMEALMSDRTDEDLDVWVAEVVFTATSRNVVGFGNSLGDVLATLSLSEEQVEKLKLCFKTLDRDSSGFVELPELKLLLGRSGVDVDAVSEELTTIMLKLDKNGDGKISEQEFFVTLSAIRKSLHSEEAFAELIDSVVAVAGGAEAAPGGGGGGNKPALAEMLLAEEAE